MLAHLYADVIEEEGTGKAGAKKKGGSMQTISATHRVRYLLILESFYVILFTGIIKQIDDNFETNSSTFCSLYYSK